MSSDSILDKYQPQTIQDFVGLAKPKLLLAGFLKRPYGGAFLFHGKPGTGKTAMASAFARALPAALHVLPAQQCTRENLARLWQTVQYRPSEGQTFHLILVDQAEALTPMHQTDLRSKLDGPDRLQNVIWVFTANSIATLDDGFRSRTKQVEFSTYGSAPQTAKLLERIWLSEHPDPHSHAPNFTRIVKEANNDIRASTLRLETLLSQHPTTNPLRA